ncbi:CDF manganese transporter [Leucosporidium creatinivorum]|uniref:CDF manganese transporter n=1 Tax=Leucosporidium creatinivorum TaxID=106004 RepID=A0A1Y2DC31_9BASI|nr:CDF manganese transporter [Leucosporidium creatinivorum]
MDHPLANAESPGRLPSPPLSPDDIDMERSASQGNDFDDAYRRHGFLATAIDQSERDPLLLKDKLQPEEHLKSLRHRKTGKKHVASHYERQNSHIQSLLKPLNAHISEAQAEEEDARLSVKIAVYGSFICNCILACLQLYAALSSLSLSFFATAIDSVFDPAANLILNYCHRKSARVDLKKYPSGGSRFETIGDIIYAFAMGCVSIVLVAFSVQDLAKGEADKELHIPAVIAVSIAFVTKFCLFLYCYSIRGKSSQVQVLWEDHRNDLFINGFGIFTSAAGAKVAWWIDPSGALFLSLVIIVVWTRTAMGCFKLLAGSAAPMEFQNLVVYNAMLFSDSIEKIDSCIVYHSGPNYIVELDIVMASETPLWKAHDLSQALQDKLEEMPTVDRAFVHVDHETSHKPEHRKKA